MTVKLLAVLLIGSGLAAAQANAQDLRLDRPTPQSRAAFLCLAQGEGFAPVPGTDTCVRAGGDLEAAILSSKLSNPGFKPLKPASGNPSALSRATHAHGFTRTYTGAGVEFESHTPIEGGSIDTHLRIEGWQPSGRW